jgi:2-iminobutanoate/2-iminopropanoate deaminase
LSWVLLADIPPTFLFTEDSMKTIALLSLLTLAAQPLAAQKREAIVPAGQRASATLTPGIRVGNIVYASGQLGMSATPDTTVGGQTKIALENTKKVFEAAGTTMAQAIKCTVFLIDVKDFGAMNQAYREFFPTVPPARSTVVVAALVVPGAKVEIECLAAMPS